MKLCGGRAASGGPGSVDQSLTSNNGVRLSDRTAPDMGGAGDAGPMVLPCVGF